MSDKRQRVDEDVYETVKFIKKWIWLSEKKRLDFSQTIERISYAFMDNHNIIKKKDISEQEVMFNDTMLNKYRVDNNFSPLLRDRLNALSYFLDKEKITKKKLTMEELMESLFIHYIEDYPEFKKLLLEDKYLFQKIKMDELTRDNRK